MARRRIKVADFRGEPTELEMPDGTVYLIRGDIPMEVVTYMSDLEERAPQDAGPEAQAEAFEAWLEDGRGLVERLVREGDPSQRDAVIPQLSAHEILGTFGAMVGGDSVGKALAEAMVSGVSSALERKREAEEVEDPTKRKRATTTRKRKAATAAA